MVVGSNLSWQCTLKGQARYVNVRGSVQWKGVYRVGNRGCRNYLIADFF